jgi:hypothetical protein
MSSSEPMAPVKQRRSPWPDGPDRSLSMFPIVTVGISTKDHDIDAAINTYADEDLSPGNRAEVVKTLKALVRHFESPYMGG